MAINQYRPREPVRAVDRTKGLLEAWATARLLLLALNDVAAFLHDPMGGNS